MDRDSELLKSAVAGDANALSELLRAYGAVVSRRLQVGPEWQSLVDVDDVMQVTYLEAFLRIEDLRAVDVASFVAWLSRVAENNLRDAIKELGRAKRPDPRRRVVARGDDNSVTQLVEALGANVSTPSRQAAGRELADCIRDAVRDLPRDYRQVIELYDLEGRAARDVAAAMRRSEGAVYMLRARAHDCLRDALGSDTRFFSGRG